MDAESRKDGPWAVAIFAVLFALFFALRQESLWSDARHLVRALDDGLLRRHHFAYPSVAYGFHQLTKLFGNVDAKLTLQLLSALSGATSGALFFLSARRLGFERHAGLFGLALVCFSPVVSFYATCVEVHALQLAFASGAFYWALCRRDDERPSAAMAALFLTGIFGSHMAGLLWGPALFVFLFWNGKSLQRPRHLFLGIAILILAAIGWRLANPGSEGQGQAHIGRSLKELTSFKPKVLYAALITPTGVLWIAGVLLLVKFRRAWRDTLRRPQRLAMLVLFACMLPFAATLSIPERGAYYITLVLPLGLMACHLLQHTSPLMKRLAPLALVLQFYMGAKQYYEWELAYPGSEWIPALQAETSEKGIIIAKDLWEWNAIQFHTQLTSISPSMPQRPNSTIAFRGEEVIVRVMNMERKRGGALGVTRNFWESDEPLAVRWRELLLENFGEPRAGSRPEFLIFTNPGLPVRNEAESD